MTQAAAILIRDRHRGQPEGPCPMGTDDETRRAERELVGLARTDAEAFGRLYRGHYPEIAGYLLRRTGDPHAAEDLASETFLSAWKALPRYRDRGLPFRAWLMRIATNKANRWSRDRKRFARLRAGAARATVSGSATEPGATDAQRALLGLPERDQSVLVLHHVEGLSVEQVGRVLGVRVGTVKSRLSRARERLRDGLRDGLEDGSAANGRETASGEALKEVSS